MPELPEVETYTRYFAKHALGQTIRRVDVRDPRILGDVRPETFARKLKGQAFASVRRHGKHLFAAAHAVPRSLGSSGASGVPDAESALASHAEAPRYRGTEAPAARAAIWLHLHFGMTGDLAYFHDRESAKAPRFARVVFEFDGGARLAFDDMRLFGLVDLVDDPDEFIARSRLGPDPLDPKFRLREFERLLERRKGAIKSLLMSQEIIAGLGNLYVDEILYQTGIHPRRPVDRLNDGEIRAIFTTMRKVLREVIARHGREAELPRNYLYHHRESGERCPRCGGTIRRSVVFGRTTYFCGSHQR